MNPIVSMNSSTGIPLSTVTFLKACSDISCFAGSAWPAAGAVFSRQRAMVAMAPSTGLDPSFIVVSLFLILPRRDGLRGPWRGVSGRRLPQAADEAVDFAEHVRFVGLEYVVIRVW